MNIASIQTLKCLSEEEVNIYHQQGYLHLQGKLPESFLQNIERPLKKWSDDLIKSWYQEGRMNHLFEDQNWTTRLNSAWVAAGRPLYERSPRKTILSSELFDFMRFQVFVNLAEDLIGSPNIAAHGLFNARPKLSNQSFTNTPWHQDAQYFPASYHSNVITMWMPLVDVDENNSCLMVAPHHQSDELYPAYNDPNSGFIGLLPEHQKNLTGKAIPMRRGDILCFNQKMPHAALPNNTDQVRWSMDLRYEAVNAPNSIALNKGFICAHEDESLIENSYDHWIESKWLNS